MSDCLFCRIISGEIPSSKVYENNDLIAFYDIDPKAPVHVLIVPKAHYQDMLDAKAQKMANVMFEAAADIAKQLGVAKDGFRCVLNTGHYGGQTVPHMHMHLLGGRILSWPPG